jgi:hypothetical protein
VSWKLVGSLFIVIIEIMKPFKQEDLLAQWRPVFAASKTPASILDHFECNFPLFSDYYFDLESEFLESSH